MELYPLNKKDIDFLIELESNSDTSEFIIPYDKEKHTVELENPLNRYLGIYEEDKLIGFIIIGIEKEGSRIEFRRIVMGEKGLGYGQKAIMKLEKYCKANWNTESIWLDVFEFNQRGRHIYEKLGYKKTGESNVKGKGLIIMEKYL